jgi:hypothetical protein
MRDEPESVVSGGLMLRVNEFAMENLERLTLAQMQEFTEAHRDVELIIEGRTASYSLMEAVLKAQHYRRLSRASVGWCAVF